MISTFFAACAFRLSRAFEWMGRKLVHGARHCNSASRWLHDASCYMDGLGSWESLRSRHRTGGGR